MITTLSQAPDSVFLEPGESLRTCVDAGTWLQVAEGRVRLVSPPGWLGQTVFMTESTLDEGEVHRLEHGGWIEVLALKAAHLRVHVPAALSAPLPVRSESRPVMRFVRLLTGW